MNSSTFPSPSRTVSPVSSSSYHLAMRPQIDEDMSYMKQEPSSGVSPVFHHLSLTRSASPSAYHHHGAYTHQTPTSRTRLTHRRTKSLYTHPRQLGFMLLPLPLAAQPYPSPLSPCTNPLSRRTPFPTTSDASNIHERHMMVNPQIAAHLKRGGTVRVRSVDGDRCWRISL
ncbi:hypothetical protein BCR39DRAFT_589997 [Naematelia encephala]|uniref:Uncharacterized protein n=1 Tax=Naematelia encephala TaxID=71784 RepID=A0A1Y2AT03_9TREE|nr:hypothetical protein BCR39DRAFT_589997 [Naematelia encephala]